MITTEKVKVLFHKTLLFRGTTRRFFLCQLNMPYVEKQLAKRKGSCLQCGKCCDLSIKCPLLKRENENISCRIYHHGRIAACKSFPIDERDLADVDFKCGYHFDN